jgi:hypothetical protein
VGELTTELIDTLLTTPYNICHTYLLLSREVLVGEREVERSLALMEISA